MTTRVVFAPDWRRQLLSARQVHASVRAAGEAVARRARGLAPRRTGAGAASVHSELSTVDGGVPEARVSWDRAHNYLRFQDYVHSRHGSARHFLERATEV